MFETKIYNGLPLSSGKAVASVCLYAPENHEKVSERNLVTDEEISTELNRFESAVKEVAEDLDKWAAEVSERIGLAEAGIFSAQKQILLDTTVIKMVSNDIKMRKRNAEAAINEVYKAYEDSFLRLENEYLRERSRDIGDIRKRLLDKLHRSPDGFLCEGHSKCRRGYGRIIVTEELTPQIIAKTDFTSVKGFITEKGGKGSHAAIIARAIGIPAVSSIHGLFNVISCGDTVFIDGETGTIVINPDEALVSTATERAAPFLSIATLSPPGTEVLANISLPEELKGVKEMSADGIGLFRTEFLFIKRGGILSEEEQESIYSLTVREMENKPVTFRLLDIGGDKPLPFLQLETEANPFLGLRGSRFLLGNRELFASQIRALAKASANGPVHILYPLVTDLTQWRKLMEATYASIDGIDYNKNNLLFGPMFEIPSSIFDAEEILREADFGSIGTNDLIQYLFAVDRNNEHVADDYNPDHPVLWEVLGRLSDAAFRAGKKLSVCGEMAANPGVASRLYSLGLKSISLSPRFIPAVREELTLCARH